MLEAAARFLETRSRSVAEVRRRLTRAGYRVALIDGAIERLVELGVLDDEAFGRAWLESRDRARPRGEHLLRRELAVKGVDRQLVSALLDERRDAEGQELDPDRDAAARLLERHRRQLDREPDPRKRRQKAYALLARNGFAPDVASEASRALAAEAADDETDAAAD